MFAFCKSQKINTVEIQLQYQLYLKISSPLVILVVPWLFATCEYSVETMNVNMYSGCRMSIVPQASNKFNTTIQCMFIGFEWLSIVDYVIQFVGLVGTAPLA